MASWFGNPKKAELDAAIERATQSSLEDIAANLEISDTIRSRAVPADYAMQSLKRRIGNKNPNVQIAALNLTDTCVKNGGSDFMEQIASREFVDNLVSLLKAYAGAEVSLEVKSKILELIQTWAGAAQGRESTLGYIVETYRTLQREGFNFPPRQEVASSMFDTSVAPKWTDSDVCMRCREPFTTFNRKHHCRNCGNVFCGSCSSKSIPLPHLGMMTPQRVDDGCYAKLASGNRADSPVSTTKTLWQGSTAERMQPRSARADDSFDADLKRALEMSLEDSTGHSGSGYVSQSQLQSSKPQASESTAKEESEEDADLKAAIAASLADMEEQKKAHAEKLKQQTASSSRPAVVAPNSKYELTPIEAENINLFATLVDRLQQQPPGAILREPQIQELYESIGALRPKLARTYGETMSKHDTLLDLHSKLATVVRYYDRMLEERLNGTYAAGRFNAPYSGGYPAMQYPPQRGGVESYYTGPASADAYQAQAPPQSMYTSSTPYPEQYPNVGAGRIPQSAPPPHMSQDATYYHPHPQAPQYAQDQAPQQQHLPPQPQRTQSSSVYPTLPAAQSAPSHTSQASSGPPPAVSPSLEPASGFYYGNQPDSPELYHQTPAYLQRANPPAAVAPKEDSLIEL